MATTGEPAAPPIFSHEGTIQTLAVSGKNADKILISVGDDNVLRRWTLPVTNASGHLPDQLPGSACNPFRNLIGDYLHSQPTHSPLPGTCGFVPALPRLETGAATPRRPTGGLREENGRRPSSLDCMDRRNPTRRGSFARPRKPGQPRSGAADARPTISEHHSRSRSQCRRLTPTAAKQEPTCAWHRDHGTARASSPFAVVTLIPAGLGCARGPTHDRKQGRPPRRRRPP